MSVHKAWLEKQCRSQTSHPEILDQNPKPAQMSPWILLLLVCFCFNSPPGVLRAWKPGFRHQLVLLLRRAGEYPWGFPLLLISFQETVRTNKPALAQHLIALKNNVLLLQRTFLEGFCVVYCWAPIYCFTYIRFLSGKSVYTLLQCTIFSANKKGFFFNLMQLSIYNFLKVKIINCLEWVCLSSWLYF